MANRGAGYTITGRTTWSIEDEVQVYKLRLAVNTLRGDVDKLIKMMEMMTKQHDDKASD